MRRLRRYLAHIRHFRGHGVHSPYIYRLSREVFLTRRLIERESYELKESLEGMRGLSERERVELQNIYTVCGYQSLSEMVVYGLDRGEEEIVEGVAAARLSGGTIVVLTSTREELCEEIVSRHTGTTLWRAGYLIIFNNHLPKQHFTL